ncbi:MAG: 6-phosphofructokinase [Phycisphaerae bacterium]
MSESRDRRLGILVGGGPAPGINSVIGSATIEAINNGMSVVGIYDGFRWLSGEAFRPETHATELSIHDVARIHFTGGSLLRTARTSLLDDELLAARRRWRRRRARSSTWSATWRG